MGRKYYAKAELYRSQNQSSLVESIWFGAAAIAFFIANSLITF